MDSETRKNWERVAEALQKQAKPDCWYYKRAQAILAGKKDPLS